MPGLTQVAHENDNAFRVLDRISLLVFNPIEHKRANQETAVGPCQLALVVVLAVRDVQQLSGGPVTQSSNRDNACLSLDVQRCFDRTAPTAPQLTEPGVSGSVLSHLVVQSTSLN